MFKFKPKKVFEKLNKMDRKQAYTIGSIVVVLVVALILLISAATGGDEDASFAGMNARGYDLAQMPFATDEAEKFLLANVYPDMKENGSTLLYSAEEKEKRQEEDAATTPALADDQEDTNEENEGDSSSDYAGTSSRGGGYGGYGNGRAGGSGKTEIGTLSSAGGMARAGGSGINATYGPSGDFRQLQRKEKNDIGGPTQLQTGNARQDLNRYHAANIATARINQNKGVNAKKAMLEGNIKGSDAFNKDGSVDLQKLQEGGLSLDTSAPPTTTDLSNLDDKVADAAQKAKDDDNKKKEDEKKWWEEMLIDLAKNAANMLVNSFLNTVGDGISGAISGARSSYLARHAKNDEIYGAIKGGMPYKSDPEKGIVGADSFGLTLEQYNAYQSAKNAGEAYGKIQNGTIGGVRGVPAIQNAGNDARRESEGLTIGSTAAASANKNNGQSGSYNNPCHNAGKQPQYNNDGVFTGCQ